MKEHELKSKKQTLESMLSKVQEKEQEIISSDLEVKAYIEYAKAKKYDELIEKDKIEIAKNNRILTVFNNNPELKKIVIEYLNKNEEIYSIKKEIEQLEKNKKQKSADAKKDEDLKPAEDKKKELEDKIKDKVEALNKNSLRPIKLTELMSTINGLSLVKDEDGKINLDASIEQKNETKHKNIERNKTILSNVVDKSFDNDGVALDGFSNYKIDFEERAQSKGITEEEYTEQRKQEIKAKLEAKHELNKPLKYEKWYSIALHPIKAIKESRKLRDSRIAYKEEYSKEVDKIHDEFIAKVEEATKNMKKTQKTITREDFNQFSFGKNSKKFIDEFIKRGMKAEEMAYDEQLKTKEQEGEER